MSLLKNENIKNEYSDRFRSLSCTSLTGDEENRWNTIKDGLLHSCRGYLEVSGSKHKRVDHREDLGKCEGNSQDQKKLLNSKSE